MLDTSKCGGVKPSIDVLPTQEMRNESSRYIEATKPSMSHVREDRLIFAEEPLAKLKLASDTSDPGYSQSPLGYPEPDHFTHQKWEQHKTKELWRIELHALLDPSLHLIRTALELNSKSNTFCETSLRGGWHQGTPSIKALRNEASDNLLQVSYIFPDGSIAIGDSF